MKPVYEAINIREGNLLAAYLCDLGIPAEVRGGAHHAVRGELYSLKGMLPQVFVLEDGDEERARAAVAEYEARLRTGVEGESWTCPGCGEVLEPQFASCWKCQGERPQHPGRED